MMLAAHSKKAFVISERKLGPFCSSSSWPLLADVSKRGKERSDFEVWGKGRRE